MTDRPAKAKAGPGRGGRMIWVLGLVCLWALLPLGPDWALAAEPAPAAQAAVAVAPEALAGGAAATEFRADVVTMLTKDDLGGELRMPSALFFDRTSDELYVLSNREESRFVVYGADYFAQESLGRGRGLDSPTGGFVDNDGNLYLTQAASGGRPARITVLNPAFLPVREISLASIPKLGNFSPQRLVRAKDGRFYVAGLDSNRVLVLDRDGAFAKWFEVGVERNGDYYRGEPAKADHPAMIRNLLVDSQGNIFFLSEETSKIYIFDANERFLFAFGLKGGSEGRLSRPRALAIDERKKCIYVVDYMRHTVLVFDMSGTYHFELGGRGWGPGWFNYPADIVVGREGQVIVADMFNQRVQVFEVKLPDLPDREPELWKAKTEGGK